MRNHFANISLAHFHALHICGKHGRNAAQGCGKKHGVNHVLHDNFLSL
ncbi:hypothetical protein GWL_17780 [Herbaspirillum sp. GW103]|nr:hypothetical protein GWL_17780 [Herbaspirillum sp. GW103]